MTTEEFSNEFDILLNSNSPIDNVGLLSFDEYEKSIFLTSAQEGLIIDVYSGKNALRDSFEKTEEIRRYLNELVKTYITSSKLSEQYTGISQNPTFFKLPSDLWFITYESVVLQDDKLGCLNGINSLVVPISQDDFFRTERNPFRGPNEKRVVRLDVSNSVVELVSRYNISKYIVRYLSKPDPIIINKLPDGLSINGSNNKTECKLNPVIHRAILERAVKLAIISRVQNTGK